MAPILMNTVRDSDGLWKILCGAADFVDIDLGDDFLSTEDWTKRSHTEEERLHYEKCDVRNARSGALGCRKPFLGLPPRRNRDHRRGASQGFCRTTLGSFMGRSNEGTFFPGQRPGNPSVRRAVASRG